MSDKQKKIRVYSSGAPDQARSESSVQLHETLNEEDLLRIRDVVKMASKKTSGKAASASGASVSRVSKAKKVAEKLTTLPPPSTKVPTQKQEQTLSVFEGQRELEKLRKSYLSTTVTEELMKFVPDDLQAIKKDGIVDIPLGRIVTEDPVVGGKKISLNPRQINQQGVDDIARRFYTMGYNSTSPVVVLVLKYNGLPFRNTRDNYAEWDEVEREKNDWWKQALLETKDKNKLSPWLLENVAGKEGDRLGYVGIPGDGKHRVKSFKETQKKFFNTKAKEFQPPKRHPSIKCLIVNVTDENLAEFLQLCIKINDQTSGGIQSMTLPLQIMNVRRIMQSLTEKQLVEMNARRTLDALVAMTNNKLKPVMTYYKSWTTGEIMKVPKLWVALMVDKIFEQDLAAWTVPDDDKNHPLFDMCQAKENQFTRLIVAAFPGAGTDYDAVLSMITSDADVAKSLGKEDLYSLCAAGISQDWIIETAKRVLCLSKDAAEALGFPRSQEKFRAFCGRLTYTYEVMLAGLEWLRELGVLKKEPVKKGAPPDDSWTPATVDIRRAFMKGGKFVDYQTWVYELALSEGEKGQYGERYLAKQAKACKTKGKGESMDVPAVGKRSVCQYLQWLFKPSEGWGDVEMLYGNVPELQNLRAVVVDAIKTDKVIGQQWESESFGSTVFSQDEERQMAYPIERDSGGVVPKTLVDGTLAKVYKRVYITRKERAEAMGLDVVVPEKEPEEEEKAKKGAETLSFSAATVYNLVAPSGAFTVPTLEALREGLEDVCMLQKGEWRSLQKGVELVWLNLPLPARVVDEEAIAGFDPQSLMEEWESETVREGVERGLSLLTGAGVLIVVGPAGVPPSLLQRQVEHAGPSKIRSTVYVTVNPKNKKGEIEYLYGCLGNTLGVYYVTIDDSSKSSVLTSSGVTETLKGAAFRAVLRKNGSFLALTWPEWEKGGKGLPLPVVQSVLGGLAKKKGTAVVINAKGGREVSALSKAGMNVVAAFSEGKSEYPGLLVDSKSGHRFGFPEMEASTVGPVVQQQEVGKEEGEAEGEKTTDSGQESGGAKGLELAAAEKLARKKNRRAGERVIESSPEPEEEGGDAQASAEGEGQAKAPEAAEGEGEKAQLSAKVLGVEKAQGAAQGEGKEKGVDSEEGQGQEKGKEEKEEAAGSGEGKEKSGEVRREGGVEESEEGGEGNEEGGEEGGEEPDPGLDFGDEQFEKYFSSLPSVKDGAGGKTEMGAVGGGGGAAGGLGPAAVVTSPLVTPLTVTPVSSGTPQSKTPRDGASLETGARDDMSRLAELEAAADGGRLLTEQKSRELTTLKRAKRKREEDGAEEEEMVGGKHAKKVGGRGAQEEYLAQVRAATEMEAAEAEAIAAAGGATGVSGKSGKGKGGMTAEDQAAILAALQEDQRPRRGKSKK